MNPPLKPRDHRFASISELFRRCEARSSVIGKGNGWRRCQKRFYSNEREGMSRVGLVGCAIKLKVILIKWNVFILPSLVCLVNSLNWAMSLETACREIWCALFSSGVSVLQNAELEPFLCHRWMNSSGRLVNWTEGVLPYPIQSDTNGSSRKSYFREPIHPDIVKPWTAETARIEWLCRMDLRK